MYGILFPLIKYSTQCNENMFTYFFKIELQVSSATNDTLNALQLAQDSLGTKSIKFSKASESNPGIPPSSFMSFSKQVSTILQKCGTRCIKDENALLNLSCIYFL